MRMLPYKRDVYFLQICQAIYQSVGKWGQVICFKCQTKDSSTLIDALENAAIHFNTDRFNSHQLYNVIIYQNIHIHHLKTIV